MKKHRTLNFIGVFLVLILLGCDPSTNKVNLERLLSPSSLPVVKSSKLYQISSTDSTRQNNDRIMIRTGEQATIFDASGPGIITRIWFTVDSRDPFFLRRIVLRMFWDDEKMPSVEVPLGDFFGCGFEYRQYVSQYLGMTSGGYICYFPMPFEKSAKIQVVNETGSDIYAFYYQIDFLKLEGYLDRTVAYFHASWNRNVRTNSDSNYVILNADGHGHVVGVNLNMQSYDGSLSFLEGNEMVWVDGEKKPSIVGTGTEDYFSGGWYFREGEIAGPFNGVILKDDRLGRIAAYRLHILDPIPFKKHILFTIEHGHANSEIADYSSTVYWYQLEEHDPFPPLPKPAMRIPISTVIPNDIIEAENLHIIPESVQTALVDVSDIGPDWSQGKHFVISSDSGSTFSMELKNMLESAYQLDIYYSTGPDFGNVRIFNLGKYIGEIKGYSAGLKAGGQISLTKIEPVYGKIMLDFTLDSRDPSSTGFLVAFDGLRITPVRDFIPSWFILGPFPNPRITETKRLGLDSVYPPEHLIDTSLRYYGVKKQPIRWRYVETPDDGYLSLSDQISPHELVVTYALTYIYSPVEKDVLLLIGTDDGAKVFFNNREVYRYLGIRVAEPDQATIPVHLKAGWNQLLMKVENNLGGYAFYARMIDPGHTLYYSARKQYPPKSWFQKK